MRHDEKLAQARLAVKLEHACCLDPRSHGSGIREALYISRTIEDPW